MFLALDNSVDGCRPWVLPIRNPKKRSRTKSDNFLVEDDCVDLGGDRNLDHFARLLKPSFGRRDMLREVECDLEGSHFHRHLLEVILRRGRPRSQRLALHDP